MAEIWGAALIAGGAVVSAGAAISAGNKAAGATKDATRDSLAEQRRQYDQTRTDFAPQRSIGNSSLDTLARLYGWGAPSGAAAAEQAAAPMTVGDSQLPPGATFTDKGKGWYDVNYGGQRVGYLRPGGPNGKFVNDTGTDLSQFAPQPAAPGTAAGGTGHPDMSAFFESPDYQFNLAEGQKAIDRSLVARSGALSGAAVKEGTRYASGLASQQYGDFTNRLLTIAGLGNAATSNTAQAGANMANNNSAAILNNGNNRASIYGQTAAGVNNSVQGGISNYMLTQYLKQAPPVTPTRGPI